MKAPLRAWPWIVAVLLVLPVCRLAGQGSLSTRDSVEVVRAFWRLALSQASVHDVLWLWTPVQADSESVAFSPEIQRSLAKHGIPASARRPTGDDTVVFRLVEWHEERGSVRLRVSSFASTVLGSGIRRCRTGSGNSGNARVRRRGGQWEATPEGPGVHGTQVCRPIP